MNHQKAKNPLKITILDYSITFAVKSNYKFVSKKGRLSWMRKDDNKRHLHVHGQQPLERHMTG